MMLLKTFPGSSFIFVPTILEKDDGIFVLGMVFSPGKIRLFN